MFWSFALVLVVAALFCLPVPSARPGADEQKVLVGVSWANMAIKAYEADHDGRIPAAASDLTAIEIEYGMTPKMIGMPTGHRLRLNPLVSGTRVSDLNPGAVVVYDEPPGPDGVYVAGSVAGHVVRLSERAMKAALSR